MSTETGHPAPRRRCFITLLSGSPVGGIETLGQRLADELLADADAVLVCAASPDAASQIDPRADYLVMRSPWNPVAQIMARLRERYRDHEVVLVALHPWTLVVFYVLRYALRRGGWDEVRGFHLVTFSRAFFFQSGPINRLETRIFFEAPRASNYFMNEPARAQHAAHWGKDLSDFPVLQLPIRGTDVRWSGPAGEGLRIVSVGRLVPFKGYNRAAPHIVRALRYQGIDAHWAVWGDGEEQAAVEREIAAAGVADFVTLEGVLPYERFHETVSRFDVFVGMGTAVLEAAQTGMPAVCAIEGRIDEGYGFLSEVPQDSVGDVVAGAAPVPLIDTLRRYAAMTPEQRRAIGEACRNDAERRARGMSEFADAVRSAEPWPVRYDPRSLALLAYTRLMLRLRAWRHRGISA